MKDKKGDELSTISLLDIVQSIKRFSVEDFSDFSSCFSFLNLLACEITKLFDNTECVLYLTEPSTDSFNLDSRIFAVRGRLKDNDRVSDPPRQNGLGFRTLEKKRTTFSSNENNLTLHPYHINRGANTAICLPLEFNNTLLGVMYLYLHEDREFTNHEVGIVEIFAIYGAMGVFFLQLKEDLNNNIQAKEAELLQLQSAAKVLFSKQNLSETLQAILDLALSLTGADYGIFRLVDEQKKYLLTFSYATADMRKPRLEALLIDQNSIMGTVAMNKKTILIEDIQSGDYGYYPLSEDILMRSELAIPLINSNGGLEGVLNLESPHKGTFTPQHKLLIESMCTFAVIAVQEFRLLESLIEITNGLKKSNFNELTKLILQKSKSLLNAELCELWERNEEGILKVGSSKSDNLDQLPEKLSSLYKSVLVSESSHSECVIEINNYYRSHLVDNILIHYLPTIEAKTHSYFLCVSMNGHQELSENGKRVIHFLGALLILAKENELHKLKLATEQQRRLIAETFAAVGDVASNVLHTINNRIGLIPVKIQSLRVKRGDLILSDPYLDKNLEEISKYSIEALNAVKENIDNLRPIELSEIELSDVINEVIARFSEYEQITFNSKFLSGHCFVFANYKNLVFIIQNIVDNAIREMQGAGIIDISVNNNNDEVIVSIVDNGPGMNSETITRLFEFEKNNPNPSNIGFGLWWAKTMMSRLGGNINVLSELGNGSTFNLIFPNPRHDD